MVRALIPSKGYNHSAYRYRCTKSHPPCSASCFSQSKKASKRQDRVSNPASSSIEYDVFECSDVLILCVDNFAAYNRLLRGNDHPRPYSENIFCDGRIANPYSI